MSSLKLPYGLRAAKIGAEKSTTKPFKVGAALLYKSNVVIAWNSDKGSPGAARWFKYPAGGTHAEFRLFTNYLLERLPIAGTVYIYRQLANGSTALAKPCMACRTMLSALGIKSIVYTDYNDTYIKEKL
jgi:hypothetical protein